METTVTILVSIYKAGEYIESKVKNLLQQSTLNNCKIVFLNCLNLDNERDFYKDHLSDNIHEIIYDKHVGLYKSWNDGIIQYPSDYICSSNVDDMWHPNYLKVMKNYLDTNKDADVISSRVLITNIKNQIDHTRWSANLGSIPLKEYPLSTAGPSPMWRRSLHDKFGLFDDLLTIGDAIMWQKWFNNGVKFRTLDNPLVLYYASPNSLERRVDSKTGKSYRQLDLETIYQNGNNKRTTRINS